MFCFLVLRSYNAFFSVIISVIINDLMQVSYFFFTSLYLFFICPPTPPPPLSLGVWGGNYEPLNTTRKKYFNCNIQSMYVITCLRKKSYEDV